MNFISGIFSGFIQTIIGFPFDTAKVLQQNGKSPFLKNPLHYYRGIQYPITSVMFLQGINFSVTKKVYTYTNNYYFSGIIGGTIVSPFIYFFDFLKINRQMNIKNYNVSSIINSRGKIACVMRESIGMCFYYGNYNILKEKYNMSSILSGSITGVISWFLTYPIDIIKTRQLTYNISIKEAIKMGKLYNGLTICLVRAFIVNSSAFYSFEYAQNKLKHFEK